MSVNQTSSAQVLVEIREGVARLTINRPPLNILDTATIAELNRNLGAILTDDAVRVVEIGAAGATAFSGGVDVRDHFPECAPEMLREFHTLLRTLLYSPRPTVALVQGYCLGGGMELALACDFIIASEDARFGQPEINVGAFPPFAAVVLPRLVPEKRAQEVILTGSSLTAEQAYELGMVNRVARDSRAVQGSGPGTDGEKRSLSALEEEAEDFSRRLLSRSAKVIELARKASRLGSREAIESALRESERIYIEELLATEDAVEGLQAFLSKRAPIWRGK